MNWQSPFSAFSPRVTSTTMIGGGPGPDSGASSTESSPEQKLSLSGFSSSSPSDTSLSTEVPMSRTHQYKKITKPLLERKRRARINKCLDEVDIYTKSWILTVCWVNPSTLASVG